ncbi:hypothetical protein IB286_04415 [Spongiibacter sp. KMU-158]|uniref:Uncharacterized protein n=1 Tax=Spongiibacter pelagi TaxID=2760804 RepID=A0A927GVM8_9GAMM|nr:hypothetical protein [Spongiibacter pelagi]MBD2858243.1 hypothetical protein [Spongiibacter pelagi]
MKSKLLAAAALLVSFSAVAEEPWVMLEEVVVVGAVRTGNAVVADINVAGDEAMQEMPVAYE